MDPAIVVLVTAKDSEEARRIAAKLLDGQLAACVNIVDPVESHFWWQGQQDQAREALLVIKSQERLLPALIAAVKAAHSYEVPEIIALPIIGGNQDYLRWISDSVKKPSSD